MFVDAVCLIAQYEYMFMACTWLAPTVLLKCLFLDENHTAHVWSVPRNWKRFTRLPLMPTLSTDCDLYYVSLVCDSRGWYQKGFSSDLVPSGHRKPNPSCEMHWGGRTHSQQQNKQSWRSAILKVLLKVFCALLSLRANVTQTHKQACTDTSSV